MNKIEQFPEYEVPGIVKHDFEPYESNGGSVVAISGEDFAIIAADTRLSSGYSIHTRKQNKLFKLSGNTVLGSAGCWCDISAFTSHVKEQMQVYLHSHNKVMSTTAIAQMCSILMYHRRFFPYYASTVLAGLDAKGKGQVYSYDPIGNYEETSYRAAGSAGSLLQPVLDNQIGYKNQSNALEKPKLTKERATSVAIDAFISAAERDIYTGDGVMINIITKDGIEIKEVPLRKD